MRITLINPPHADWSLCNTLTYAACRTYYNAAGQHHDEVEWIEPPYRWDEYQSAAEVADLVAGCDVVMFSSYVWNYDIVDAIAKIVKGRNPSTIVALGGPHIGDVSTRPQYDFVCQPTKPGEVFIRDLIDSHFTHGYPRVEDISWAVGSQRNDVYKLDVPVSIYRDNFDHFKTLFEYCEQKELEPFIALETTRGCPYSCVFCEWGGGIGTKVYKKATEIVKQDLDAIAEIGFTSAYLTDANFGIFFDRDVEIYRIAFSKGVRLTDVSTFKSKDLAKRIQLIDAWFDIVGENALPRERSRGVATSQIPNISIQSISDGAMRIAKRSDLSVADKIKLSEYIRTKCSENKYPVPNIEMILAMPGSTREDFYQEMTLFWNFKSTNERYDYMILPDSEINKAIYQELYDIRTVEVIDDMIDEEGAEDYTPLYRNKTITFRTMVSCHSYTADELKEMWFMNICTGYLLRTIYPMFEYNVQPPQFMKHCFAVISQFPEYTTFKAEIDDIFDPSTPPRSIRKLGGQYKKDAVEQFLEANKQQLVREVTLALR